MRSVFVGVTLPLKCNRYWKKLRLICKKAEEKRAEEIDQQRNQKRTSIEIEYMDEIYEPRKRNRNKNQNAQCSNLDKLPDDLIIVIMCKLSASADSPSDTINARLA
jgi:hypothetical protein